MTRGFPLPITRVGKSGNCYSMGGKAPPAKSTLQTEIHVVEICYHEFLLCVLPALAKKKVHLMS